MEAGARSEPTKKPHRTFQRYVPSHTALTLCSALAPSGKQECLNAPEAASSVKQTEEPSCGKIFSVYDFSGPLFLFKDF